MNRRKFLSLIGLTSVPSCSVWNGAERKEVVDYPKANEFSFILESGNGMQVRLVDFVRDSDGKYSPRFELISKPDNAKRNRNPNHSIALIVG